MAAEGDVISTGRLLAVAGGTARLNEQGLG